MNNKKLGTGFEREMVDRLSTAGFWVHFISPDASGAQPFDLIFAKNGIVNVADCKTCKEHIFRIDRLEWNQVLAFEKWIRCGNKDPLIFVKYNGTVKIIQYSELKLNRKVDLDGI